MKERNCQMVIRVILLVFRWETQFIVDASVDDASLIVRVNAVHNILDFNLAAVMINPTESTVEVTVRHEKIVY